MEFTASRSVFDVLLWGTDFKCHRASRHIKYPVAFLRFSRVRRLLRRQVATTELKVSVEDSLHLRCMVLHEAIVPATPKVLYRLKVRDAVQTTTLELSSARHIQVNHLVLCSQEQAWRNKAHASVRLLTRRLKPSAWPALLWERGAASQATAQALFPSP